MSDIRLTPGCTECKMRLSSKNSATRKETCISCADRPTLEDAMEFLESGVVYRDTGNHRRKCVDVLRVASQPPPIENEDLREALACAAKDLGRGAADTITIHTIIALLGAQKAEIEQLRADPPRRCSVCDAVHPFNLDLCADCAALKCLTPKEENAKLRAGWDGASALVDDAIHLGNLGMAAHTEDSQAFNRKRIANRAEREGMG